MNEPSSDDPKFFKGKALTYYGRWIYKFEETARHGAIGDADHSSHRPRELRLASGAQLAWAPRSRTCGSTARRN